MRKIKRIMATVLAGTLGMMLCTGCGANDESKKAADNDTDIETDESEVTDESDADSDAGNSDESSTDTDSDANGTDADGDANSTDDGDTEKIYESSLFMCDVWDTVRSDLSGHVYYDFYSELTGTEIGGADWEESDDGWSTVKELLKSEGIYEAVGLCTDFSDYYDFVEMSGVDEKYYSDKAYQCVGDGIEIVIAYNDLTYDDSDNFVHSGNYYGVSIQIIYEGSTVSFYMEW